MSGRGLAGRLALVGGCALVSALMIAAMSDRPMLAASMPAEIWAPRGGLAVAVVPTAAAVLAVALAGPRRRPGALLLWLAVLALVTHRVVDIGPDGLSDMWLGVPVRTFGGWREVDGEPRQCGLALCITRAGQTHRLPTLLPFAVVP